MDDLDATIPPKRVREPDAPDLDATLPPKRMLETERAIPQDFDPERTIPNRRMRREMGEFSVGDVIAYRYLVISVLGRGAMGVVYRCFDKVASIEVALKGLPPELAGNDWEMKEIRRNFQLVHNLHHPNIASYNTIELDQTSGGYFLVMEFVDGVELRTYMENNRPDHVTIINIIAAIAAALDYAHAQQILHRDIKPGNIMIDRNGIVKILDFGLAAQIHSSMSKVSMIQDSSGTAPYMSPEQWRGRRQNASCDQYALGVVAYEMFAGFLPFESTDHNVLRSAVLNEAPEPLTNVSPSIQYAVNKALGKTPEERFPNCTAFAQALTAPVETPAAIVSPPPMPVKSKSPVGKIIIAIIAALLLLGGGIGTWLALQKSENTETKIEEQELAEAERKAREAEEKRKEAVRKEKEAEERLKEARRKAKEVEEKRKELELKMKAEEKRKEAERRAKEAEEERKELERQKQEAEEKRKEEERRKKEAEERAAVSGSLSGQTFTVPLPNGVKLEMVRIPNCAEDGFMMGSPRNEANRDSDETQHKVYLTRDFYLGKYEVTQEQWKALMKTDVYQQQNKGYNYLMAGVGGQHPMYFVNYDEALDFCNELNKRGYAPDGWKFTLPTEAQWEYACRAGTATAYSYGDSADSNKMNYSSSSTVPVGSKRYYNNWGLYDMHGNVLEWCLDYYNSNFYSNGATTDPLCTTGSYRVIRGGSWADDAQDCRSANCLSSVPTLRYFFVGFRLALVQTD